MISDEVYLLAYNLAFSIKKIISHVFHSTGNRGFIYKTSIIWSIYFNFSNNVLPTRTAEAGFCPVISSRSTTTFGVHAVVLL